MTTQTRRRIEALRILDQSIPIETMAAELNIDGVLSHDDIEELRSAYCKWETFAILLHRAEKAGKLTLAWYEWQVLPELRVKLQIVSPSGVRTWDHVE